MKKWLVVIALLVLTPAGSLAQITFEQAEAETVIDAAEFGDGWEMATNEIGGSSANPWDRRMVYYGPSGASIVIEAYEFDATLSELSAEFRDLYVAWMTRGYDLVDEDRNVPYANQIDDAGLELISDAYRAEDINASNGLPFGYGLYGSLDARTAITIHVEGTVNGLTGVAATDFIAGLYFAALSAD